MVMPNNSRYLITTSDECTWKFDRPVIFLGEWCRLYERKHIWQDMDAIVAEPYGLSQANKNSDHAEVLSLESKLFPALCDTLNHYHRVKHSERFWRIVLGHWLRRYIEVMLNRIKTLEQCLQAYQISGTTGYSNEDYTLATTDSYSAIWAFNDDRWNNALNISILALLEEAHFPINRISDCALPAGFHYNALPTTGSFNRSILTWSYQKLGKLASYLVKDSDAFIINSYLPKKEEIKLQLALFQYPQLWVSPKLKVSEKTDRELRQNLANQVASKSCIHLQDILSVMVFELLPICYLEGFADLNKMVKQQPWPETPKFIFTSNNFDTDEVFKLWTATKIESGIKYFTGQHGNNYGVTRNHLDPSNEEITSDKFLTWGWTDGLPQHTPAFIFKTTLQKAQHYNPQGGLLFIELHLNFHFTTFDYIADHINYFTQQQIFVNELARTPKQHLIIRLHAAYRYTTWNDEARWQAFDPALTIDTGGVPISDLIAQSRLVVHSYDSTGILETLSQNIPTLAFWQNGFDHLRESAKPYYQLLLDAGIVHLSPESVAQKVNEIWNDVDGWWAQSKVQGARKQFCERYARVSHKPVSELKKIFLS
jgi:putative transferase (TIGR04331 family)